VAAVVVAERHLVLLSQARVEVVEVVAGQQRCSFLRGFCREPFIWRQALAE
jgi:hypothetical protein